jgi:hypothetical protein
MWINQGRGKGERKRRRAGGEDRNLRHGHVNEQRPRPVAGYAQLEEVGVVEHLQLFTV